MADTFATDEFSFPLRATERLYLAQGGRLSEGEYALPPSSMRQPGETGEPGPFSLLEYSQAVGENVIFNMCRDIEARRLPKLDGVLDQMKREHAEGRIGDVPVIP